MLKDPEFKKEYTDFIQNLLDKKYAVKSQSSPEGNNLVFASFWSEAPKEKEAEGCF